MGNCLKCTGSNQQDNTTLLSSNNSDSALHAATASHESLGPSVPYNEAIGNYYPSIAARERFSQSTEFGVTRGIGVGVNVLNTSGGNSSMGTNPLSGIGGGGIGLSEDEQQLRIAKRIGLIQHLPMREYDGTKKGECVICMMDLVIGEEVRYLPCMHTYHAVCIDDWLLRSLTCPSCMEPVDAALINSYHPTT